MSRRYLRPEALAGHLLVLIAVLVCLRLGWWQWNVAHETRGTIQNLGYALLWPVFGGAFIFMWLRFLYLEDERRAERDRAADVLEVSHATPADEPPDHPLVARKPDAPPTDGAPAHAVLDGETPTAPSVPAAPNSSARRFDGPDTDRDPPTDQAAEPGDADPLDPHVDGRQRGRRGRTPSTAVTIAVATVGADDEDDPELSAYNAALARLAEQDDKRAR